MPAFAHIGHKKKSRQTLSDLSPFDSRIVVADSSCSIPSQKAIIPAVVVSATPGTLVARRLEREIQLEDRSPLQSEIGQVIEIGFQF
jgi:hypothetical protein